MTHRRLAAAGAVLLVLLGLTALARRYLERVPVTVWRGASAEVRRQPRLALERLLAAGGITPRIVVPGAPDAVLPARAVMWLDEDAIDPSRAATDRTWRWVEAGGTLVLSPTAAGGPLSDRLDLRRREVRPSADGRLFDAPATISVGLPGSQRRYEIQAPVGFLLPAAPRRGHGDGAGGLAVAEVPVGRGRIVIVANLAEIWTNSEIGLRDHAAFLWALARLDGPRAPLLFTTVPPAEISASTIVRRSWPLLVGAALMGLLALWRVLPRPGPTWRPPAPARRQLGEHLQAVGTFHLRSGGRQRLVDVAQRAVQDRLRRQPWMARPSDTAALAASPASPADTLDLLQRLHELWRRLHRT
jgi:hypothetical protein